MRIGQRDSIRPFFPVLAKEIDIPMNFKISDVGEYMSGNIDLNMNDLGSMKIRAMYHYPCHIRASGLAEEIYIDLI